MTGEPWTPEPWRRALVDEVAGHMPASGECNEYLIRGAVRWGYDQVIAPRRAEHAEMAAVLREIAGTRAERGEDMRQRAEAALARIQGEAR